MNEEQSPGIVNPDLSLGSIEDDEDDFNTSSIEMGSPQSSQTCITKGGRNYKRINFRFNTGISNERETTHNWHHKAIAELYEVFDKWVSTSKMDCLEQFEAEHKLWTDSLSLLNIPDHTHISPVLWGRRPGMHRVSKKTLYDKPNPSHVPTSKLSWSGRSMQNVINQKRKQGFKMIVFLIRSTVRSKNPHNMLHTNVLVVKPTKEGITYFVYEPRTPDICQTHYKYKPLFFLADLTVLSFFNKYFVCFGDQKGDLDCFHGAVDWVGRLLGKQIVLKVDECSEYEIRKGRDKSRLLPIRPPCND